jgi:hypothetical protein
VSPAAVDAISNGQRPAGTTPDVETAYNFIAELLKTRQLSDPGVSDRKEQFRGRSILPKKRRRRGHKRR